MSRKAGYLIIMISFLSWLKTNNESQYIKLTKNVPNLPINMVLDLIDALYYYNSLPKALKVLVKWSRILNKRRVKEEERKTAERASELYKWATSK